MGKQPPEPVLELMPFTFPYVFDLLGDVPDIGLIEPARAEQGGITLRPFEEIPVVEVLGHHARYYTVARAISLLTFAPESDITVSDYERGNRRFPSFIASQLTYPAGSGR